MGLLRRKTQLALAQPVAQQGYAIMNLDLLSNSGWYLDFVLDWIFAAGCFYPAWPWRHQR
jgi:hypothetical protein